VKAEPTIGESEVYRFMEDVLDDELHLRACLPESVFT
jgi:hypothetical protein